MILVIDNYDSFTYNLVQALGEMGADIKVFRNDMITLDEIENISPAGLLISPGPCTPAEAGISVSTVKRFAGSIPILGVCLGHQSIAAAFGADVVRAQRIMHGKTSWIEHDGKGVFRGLDNPFEATRYHSLTVPEDSLPPEILPTARTTDRGELMGIRHRKFHIEGVQFHPESFLTREGNNLLRNFLEICGEILAPAEASPA